MSFTRKLVLYFVVLSLLPLAAAFLAFQPAVERGETAVVDGALRAALRASAAAYGDVLADRREDAVGLARSPGFQRALTERDRAAVARSLAGHAHIRLEAGGFRVGARPPGPAAEARVSVLVGRRHAGDLVAAVPFDRALAGRLTKRSGLAADEVVVLVGRGRIVGGTRSLDGAAFAVRPGSVATVSVGDARYRVAVARGTPTLAAFIPHTRIEGAVDAAERRLLAAFALSLLLVGAVAYLEGRSIVRVVRELVRAAGAIAGGRLDRRVTVRGRDELAQLGEAFNEMAAQLERRLAEVDLERRRVREVTVRFAEALSAALDVDQLRLAIVEAAVEATSASGGAFTVDGREVARSGEPDGDDRIELPVVVRRETFGALVLWGPRFDARDIESASLLVGHAAVAFENVRLHRVVERQALVDALTGLANRRRAEEALARELARADRYATPVSIVLADLDDFKAVNDGHGHEAGDEVLRACAAVLAAGVRAVDLPARWGGEEFLLLLPDTDAAGAAAVAERLRAALASTRMLLPDGAVARVAASFGVASFPPAGSREELLAGADAALYEAKRAGKDRVVVTAAVQAQD
ncbi:MAG: diguanylate cyclase [Thermoleophilia bacterium]|nr:diguanylate cyclase [Thermoleophilia bacterium]